jgi:cell division septation protein DedD
MASQQLEKLWVRSDLVEGDPVAPALLRQTERRKRQQTTAESSVKNWRRIRAVLNVCTRRRTRRLLRCAGWLLLVGVVAYFGYLALLDDDRPADQTRIPPPDQQQNTISSRSMHGAPPEERSFYSLTSTPPDVAMVPPKNGPPVLPDRNIAATAAEGSYVVQVAAERSDTEAQASFKTLQSKYPDVLGSRSPLVRRVDLGKRGIKYRAQIGPFDTVEQAKQLCARLKAAGGHCIVKKGS